MCHVEVQIIVIINIVIIIISIVLIIISIVIIIIEFDKIYERLGATITERGESFYQPMMSGLVEDLTNKGMFLNYHIINY